MSAELLAFSAREMPLLRSRALSGFGPLSAHAYWVWRHYLALGQSVLLVMPSTSAAQAVYHELLFFSGQRDLAPSVGGGEAVHLFPAWDVLPFEVISPSVEVTAARIETLHAALTGKSLVVVGIDALLQRIAAPQCLQQSIIKLTEGETYQRQALIKSFVNAGYVRCALVEELGQMAVRGAVIDIFPPATANPLRLEFFGDTLESLRFFDPATQRSTARVNRFSVLPVRELFFEQSSIALEQGAGAGEAVELACARLRQRASELHLPGSAVETSESALREGIHWPGLEHLQGVINQRLASLLEYFAEQPEVLLYNEPEIAARAEEFVNLVDERAWQADREGRVHAVPEIAFNSFAVLRQLIGEPTIEELQFPDHATLRTELRYVTNKELPLLPLAQLIEKALARGEHIGVTVSLRPRMSRIQELLQGYQLSPQIFSGNFAQWLAHISKAAEAQLWILGGALSQGFIERREKYCLISDREIFPNSSQRMVTAAARSARRFLGSLLQMSEGDYVVHADYGIARYKGLSQLKIEFRPGEFRPGEFLELEYAEGAVLYVPVEKLSKVQKYAAAEGIVPALTRLGGQVWEKAKLKVKQRVAELAGQLMSTMAQREVEKGISFGELDEDDRSFKDTFPYQETPDQAAAIEAVLQDMAREKPMDRLVCGDVGYGKTEVAMRAAFKAANRGKQVAVLVPTTVLAEQHFRSFQERFSDTALRVACVSRFNSRQQNTETLHAVAMGKIDIVIGTHRLLQKDVQFADLGLLVIDEEHRFGVAHKEKLKRLRSNVDVLTLSATPIPRTLHTSLAGIREMSLIETPPVDRQVIRTYLAERQESLIREAILRELARGGQVFYVHNRVQSIAALTGELRELIPEARFIFGHGQMPEGELELVMRKFVLGEVDVLVCTTIVESGLDIPNANTIIIEDADRFGLAELYQLRGRVGRSDRRAYAYLLVGSFSKVTEGARKRLDVLRSLDDLGVGFRLAMRDLEIRGAGNLLGRDQSGHVQLVGYELYTRILREAVEELRARQGSSLGKVRKKYEVEPEIRLGYPAFLPPEYVPDVVQRLIVYQRLVEVGDEREIAEIGQELSDRFGRMPGEVQVLLDLMALRALLKRHGVSELRRTGKALYLSFHPAVGQGVIKFLPQVFKKDESCAEEEQKVPEYSLGEVFNAVKEVLQQHKIYDNLP